MSFGVVGLCVHYTYLLQLAMHSSVPLDIMMAPIARMLGRAGRSLSAGTRASDWAITEITSYNSGYGMAIKAGHSTAEMAARQVYVA